jgi:magnesium-transporting ATPase (P-type)
VTQLKQVHLACSLSNITALKVAGLKAGLDIEVASVRYLRVKEFPFESRRKRMSTVHNAKVNPYYSCVRYLGDFLIRA